MKRLILQEPGEFVLDNVSNPEKTSPGEALVKVHRIGVYGTDLHAFRGKQPFFVYPKVIGTRTRR